MDERDRVQLFTEEEAEKVLKMLTSVHEQELEASDRYGQAQGALKGLEARRHQLEEWLEAGGVERYRIVAACATAGRQKSREIAVS